MCAFKSANHIHAISFLVKYTKTLSVRNQHVRYSLSFFCDKRANSHTSAASHRDSTASTRIIAVPLALVDGVESVVAAPRVKLPASKRINCHLPYFNLLATGAGPVPQKILHRVSRARRDGAAATNCFQFRRDYETPCGALQADYFSAAREAQR
jgi:hypothetical protein